MMDYKVIAEDLLLNASDYIGSDPKNFGADRKDLDTIKNNDKFCKMVFDEVEDYPEEYEDLPQEEAARIVWDLYLSWAY